jgi:hypothetical protein
MKILSHHFLILLTCLSVFISQRSIAIPTYTRQYNLSCASCHSPVPKLTPFGNEFAANGFQLGGMGLGNSTVQTDDSSLSLLRELPLAVRFDGFVRAQLNDEQKTDLEWPFVMKIFSSGQIKEDISYFFYFLMNEGGNISGVEDAFLYFNDIAGKKFDVTVGQFQVADLMFKRELRPTFEDYQIYQIKPGLTKADLTYDRGLILNYTLPSETDLFISVVNGNGIGPSTDGLYDSDPYKNVVARIARQVSSMFTAGTLGYFGKESISENINRLSMIGGDATFAFDKFELLAQYVYRHDTNPFFLAGRDSTVNSQGGFIQLMYAPQLNKSDWYLFFLYNNVRSDIEDVRYQSVAFNVTFMLSRNFKLTGELGADIERHRNTLTFGFMTAF